MLSDLILKSKRMRAWVAEISAGRAQEIVRDIEPYLKPSEKILEIGAGTCVVTNAFRQKGHNVTPLDIHDVSCVPSIKPTVFDGKTFPFPDDSFDVGLLLNVLHHIPDPLATIKEVHRVARRIIIHEDIYDSFWRKYATFVMDSVTNLEFFGHPHSNRDDAGWKKVFAYLGLRITKANYKTFWRIFQNVTYCVDRES
ncbi:MAG: methyltransferase domain-containing protein [Patescibacteria group bacterium]